MDKLKSVDLGARAVWVAQGREPLKFLQAMLTQELEGLEPGRSLVAALLTAKGRIRAVVRVGALPGGSVLLDADLAAHDEIVDGLVRVAPLAGVELLPIGCRLERTVTRLADPSWFAAPLCVAVEADDYVVEAPWGTDRFTSLLGSSGVGPSHEHGSEAEAARIRSGLPAFGLDVDDGTLINETPLMRFAVAADKGCYPGQESVARVRNLGRVRRRLSVLALDVSTIPARDAFVTMGGEQVGQITSAGRDDVGVVCLAMLDAAVADTAEADGAAETLLVDGSIPARVTYC